MLGLYFRLTFDSDLISTKTGNLFENDKKFKFPLEYQARQFNSRGKV